MKYTDEQIDAAQCRSERVIIRALAGTGKTETVALRASQLSQEDQGVSTVMCFTRAARDQLTRRLVDRGVDGQVETVHASAHATVSRWFDKRELRMPRVSDGFNAARRVVRSAGFKGSDTEVDAVLRMSTSKWNGTLAVSSVPTTMSIHDLQTLADMYAMAKRERNVIDFDDLVVIAAEVCTPVSGEVIVDEAQDLSTVQVAYVEALAGNNSMTWVGDPYQAVFGFAGVDGGIFDRLVGWESFTLSESFRSSEAVLDAANQLIAPDRLKSRFPGGVVHVRHVDFEEQASVVAEMVDDGDVVLARTRDGVNTQCECIEDAGWGVRRNCAQTLLDRGVDVSTVHSAKGSEWRRVFVIGCDDDGFNGFEASSEEKRLMYVALTRARESITVLSMTGAMPWGVRL